MNYTIADKITELKNMILNKEIEIECCDSRKQAGKYQVLRMELEAFKNELQRAEECADVPKVS